MVNGDVMLFRNGLSVILAVIFFTTLLSPLQAQQPDDPAARLLARMSPAGRVGQLFLVTFPGTDTGESSAIRRLILEEQIGGVLLRSQNGNIVNSGDTPRQLATLTNELQQLAWDVSQIPASGQIEVTGAIPFVPLFTAVELEGKEGLVTRVVSGTTALPSPMAIGATWNPTHAEAVGGVIGEELSELGVNLLLGLSLDVLDTPRPGKPADLGTLSFGGDPYWVGKMGGAFIRGVHSGSEGRVAVVPGHFPGLGAADRPFSEEVSTVQKSLEQLKQIELAPFFAVASAEDVLDRPDGLLISHIRYRGFQGNIYASTKPVSFDPQALQQLMALPELSPWRAAGGIAVADELGVRAVRRFYDPTEQQFNSRRIALEAFLAGNDLLILSHFALSDDWESHVANVQATIQFFREKYASDPTFQAKVDEAVLRILQLKLDLYGSFSRTAVQVDVEQVTEQVGGRREQIAPVAQSAVTLLSPPSPELRPAPPAADERIVIFTDDRRITPCAGCTPVYAIPPTQVADTLVRLYGPEGTRQVWPYQVSSFTFSQLIDYLEAPPAVASEEETPAPPAVEVALQEADWVLFAMLDVNEQVPQSGAVRHFLAEKADLLRGKKVVVFAFAAPYYLDTTEIAKLSAYFGLYSHAEPFIEAAARALFDEFAFAGSSPVTVPGINYNLLTQTQPDPNQVIEILLVDEVGEEIQDPQEIQRGGTLRLRTNAIIDRNGHPVPDGTPVEFIFTYPQEGLEHTVPVTTRDGVAETTVTLDRTGQLQVSVRAEPVPRAVRLEMEIREGEPALIVSITPTPRPTPQPAPTDTPAPTPEIAPAPAEEAGGETGNTDGGIGWLDFGQGLVVMLLVALAGYYGRWQRERNSSWALRGALWCAAGGLVAYIGLALGLPGVTWIEQRAGVWTAGVVVLVGAAISLTIVLIGDAVRRSGKPSIFLTTGK